MKFNVLENSIFAPITAALLLASGATALAQERDDDAAMTQLLESAAALGGLNRLRTIERMRLYGYGQEADGFGSGNASGSPHAPQKYNAHNDLQRIWDFDNDRYMERQRGYFLFPFASSLVYRYSLNMNVLDGDVSYTIGGGFGVSNPDEPRRTDNVRELRMWSISNNPVTAVRAALEDGSTLNNMHVEDGSPVVDVELANGEEFTIGFEWASDLPEFVRWSGPNHYLGEVRYTTWFTGYVPYDGINLPLGIVTGWDWRDVDVFKIYGEGWVVDGEIPDMAAPESVRGAELREFEQELDYEMVADGIWRISNGTTVVEFADHLLVFELGGFGYDAETLPIIELARSIVPSKPLTHYIASHHHDDHSSGLRTAVAEGLTVISHYANEGIYREIAGRPAPNYPDQLHREPQPLRFIGITDGHLRLQDSERTLDIYHVLGHNHMANAVFAYDPNERVMIEADIAPAEEWQWWADAYVQNLEHYDLDVDVVSSTHFGVMSHQEMLDFLAPGRVRVQENCVARAEAGIYRTGCPPFFPEGDLVGMSDYFDPPFE
jgi:glyoxylase-like metal-dependent hydrolase (beta-lactamase superfamily II)